MTMPDRPTMVLLVDPFPDERKLFRESLESVDCRVIAIERNELAFTTACSDKPDVIVLRARLDMRSSECLRLAQSIRESERTRTIPIVLLTTDGFADEQIAIRAGCDRVLLLPVMPEELVTVIDGVVSARPV